MLKRGERRQRRRPASLGESDPANGVIGTGTAPSAAFETALARLSPLGECRAGQPAVPGGGGITLTAVRWWSLPLRKARISGVSASVADRPERPISPAVYIGPPPYLVGFLAERCPVHSQSELRSIHRVPLSANSASVRACVRRAQCTRRALDVDPPLRPLGVCRRPATPDCARARVRVPGRVGHVVFCCSTHDASIPRRHRASFAAPASSHALHVHLIPLASFLFVRSPPSPRPRKGGRTSYGLAAWWKPLPGMERIHARSERPSNIRVIISGQRTAPQASQASRALHPRDAPRFGAAKGRKAV
ncbi:hypothetical protein HPB47_021523, partial [Ixodes persulcatus]